ncbi:MAG: hypothetical protein GXY83_22590, partial [Rhodopirellula sp.]|nr:hypothetical protein [Rhodopirellula sp.]
PCLITVRDAHLSCYDLTDGGHLYFRGIRSGCTNNVIPAGGILSAPHAMRHCTCNYAVATSLALVNMPEASHWNPEGHVSNVSGTIPSCPTDRVRDSFLAGSCQRRQP